MAQGSVGGGSQNNWKEDGIIFVTPPSGGRPFKKKEGNGKRNESAFWVADTPVTWNEKVGETESDAKASVADVGNGPNMVPNMLVTYDSDGKTILEYHPLITFFNEVLAKLMNDDARKNSIKNLKGPVGEQNAIKLWRYLEETYL